MTACIDFETHSIGERPEAYPPVPVGVAVQIPGTRAKYFAWGHPTKNNCTQEDARRVLSAVYDKHELLFHNAQFDLEVAHDHMGLPLIPRHGFHDTLLLAFLHDPNAQKIGLKHLAEDLLDMPAQEQSELRGWIQEHVPGAKRLKREWARHIKDAPGTLVGKYAVGDITRTRRLFDFFAKQGHTTSAAYARECRLLPVLMGMSRRGVPVNINLLEQEIEDTEASLHRVERWLTRKLGSVNLDANEEVADAMERKRMLSEWVLTDKGNRSLAIENLRLTDCSERFVGALELRALLSWNLRTHLRKWYEQACYTGGVIHCNWNQVRQAQAYGRAYGARTGRLSSNPNLQNITKRVRLLVSNPKTEGLLVPKALADCHVPDPRRVVAAPRGQRLLGADYSGQELRILAYCVGGELRRRYIDDASYDLISNTQVSIQGIAKSSLSRTHTKNVIYGRIYGSGIQKTAQQIGSDYETARRIRASLEASIPGLQNHDFELRAQKGCTTWGGRWNPAEPSTFQNGEWRSFDYKLLNTEIQGSAADVTKEAMVGYAREGGQILLSAHDELLAIAPTGEARKELNTLRDCMEAVNMHGIPMPTEGSVGATWRDCK